MRVSIFAFLSLLLIVLVGPFAQAQEKESNKASIDELAWIAGQWHGEAMGGQFEESWNPPSAGTMSGVFKLSKDKQIQFYEILTIVTKGDSLVLRLKHFDKDLVGWEEKDKSVEFPLKSVTDTEAVFDGLTFRKIDANQLHIEVAGANKLLFKARRRAANPSSAINSVLEIDRILSSQRNNLSRSQSLASSVEAYLVGLENVDFSRCTDQFKQAFDGHREAWKNSIPFLKKHSELRGEMHEQFDNIRAIDDTNKERLNKHFDEIMQTWSAVEQHSQQK